jgi:hypothetical protein
MTDQLTAASVIEIRIRDLAQLFNSLDPSPFHDRDLDQDAEEYIVGWARELPSHAALQLVIHLPAEEAAKAEESGLATALAHYFAERANVFERELRENFRSGWHYLRIGVPILILCLIASQLTRSTLGTSPFARAIEESFIIVGWVANWKPIETFLYDWWPLKRRRDLYRRLQAANVVIIRN